MDYKEMYNRHFQNVKKETSNPVILNDIVSQEIGQYPEHRKKQAENSKLTQTEEIARDNIDGKTWQSTDE